MSEVGLAEEIEIRLEVGRAGRVVFVGHSKGFGFYSECSGKPREGFTEGSDRS